MHTAGGKQALGEEGGNVGPGLEEIPGGPGQAFLEALVLTGLQYFFQVGPSFKTLSLLNVSEIQQSLPNLARYCFKVFRTCLFHCAPNMIFTARFFFKKQLG